MGGVQQMMVARAAIVAIFRLKWRGYAGNRGIARGPSCWPAISVACGNCRAALRSPSRTRSSGSTGRAVDRCRSRCSDRSNGPQRLAQLAM